MATIPRGDTQLLFDGSRIDAGQNGLTAMSFFWHITLFRTDALKGRLKIRFCGGDGLRSLVARPKSLALIGDCAPEIRRGDASNRLYNSGRDFAGNGRFLSNHGMILAVVGKVATEDGLYLVKAP